MAKEKTTGFFFKMSPQEWEWVERRMAETNIKNKSAFIRKMCINGHVINLDMSALNEISRLLRITANNVNQIAKHVNATHEIYAGDIKVLQNGYDKVWAVTKMLLDELTKLQK